MPDFSYTSEIVINAPAQKTFDIVSNPANHAELAGRNELNKVTQSPAGPVGLGIHIMAEETVMMADGTGMDLTADSIVVTFDAPNSFSFVVNPALPEQIRRIQRHVRMAEKAIRRLTKSTIEKKKPVEKFSTGFFFFSAL